jgi:hypothetical protein
MTPNELRTYKANVSEDKYLEILTAASSDRSGYVREVAVKEMVALGHPAVIPFLLTRLGDWVGVVRQAAKEGVRHLLKKEFLEAFLLSLPQIQALVQKRRTDLSDIHKEIVQFIISKEYGRISQLPDKSRILYAKYYLQAKSPQISVVKLLATDKNPLVRQQVLKRLAIFGKTQQYEFMELFLQDADALIRRKALAVVKDFRPALDALIYDLAADESATVRLFARHELKNEAISFPDLYRRHIQKRYKLAGSILGLAEVGTKDDIPLVEPHIWDTERNIQFVSLHALYLLNPASARDYALQLLTHDSKKIRYKSAYILTGYAHGDVLEKIKTLFCSATAIQKKTILYLCNKQGGWEILEIILLAIKDTDVSVRDKAWFYLRQWNHKARNLYHTPDTSVAQRLIQKIDAIHREKSVENTSQKRVWEELVRIVKNKAD